MGHPAFMRGPSGVRSDAPAARLWANCRSFDCAAAKVSGIQTAEVRGKVSAAPAVAEWSWCIFSSMAFTKS
jgi:hypothetical protein